MHPSMLPTSLIKKGRSDRFIRRVEYAVDIAKKMQYRRPRISDIRFDEYDDGSHRIAFLSNNGGVLLTLDPLRVVIGREPVALRVFTGSQEYLSDFGVRL